MTDLPGFLACEAANRKGQRDMRAQFYFDLAAIVKTYDVASLDHLRDILQSHEEGRRPLERVEGDPSAERTTGD